jgi:outer membrane protein assembly factor BamB
MIGNVAVTAFEHTVTAWALPDWTPRWTFAAQLNSYDVGLPPLVVGRTIFFTTSTGHLRALDLMTGQLLWSKLLDASPGEYDPGSSRALAVGEGLLLVPAEDGLMAFESE